MTACCRNAFAILSLPGSRLLPRVVGSEPVPTPSPLVGEGREGGTAPRRDAREAISSGYKEGGPVPPSPALPHKGGEGMVALAEGGTR
jgi:hypothetical protein